MSAGRKFLVGALFVAVLVGLGTTDALFTRGTLKLPPPEGIAKQPGPDVVAVAQAQGFTALETTEKELLTTVLPTTVTLYARVLLKNDDRAATVAWIESPDVKDHFVALKKHLRPLFSSALADLVDRTETPRRRAPRDLLSFRDPEILEGKAVFVRVRERLYELHVKEGQEEQINRLLDALTE